jgi:hypothetical protein
MRKYVAFKNKPELKEKYVTRMEAHAKADELIQGTYWENGKGCSTGCLMHSSTPHKKMETVLGIPETVAYLNDRIFEGLDKGDAQKFAQDFIRVIPVGADLSLITPKFMVWLMKDLRKYAKGYPDVLKALKTVADLYQKIIDGGVVSDEEWALAAEAARAAWAAEAARAAARAARAAAWVARVARVAEAVAEAAAEAAWAAWAAAEADQYKKMAKKLLELLAEAK